MNSETRELWLRLCEQAAVEQDSAKLFQLVQEINRLLEEKEQRLKRKAVRGSTDSWRNKMPSA
jgi:hypothetical protein